MIRIVIADDHPVIRAGIRKFLEAKDDLAVVAEAASGPQALSLVRQHAPDVLLLDMEMPDTSGVDVARELHGDPSVGTRILALSAYSRRAYVEGLLQIGAAGYITKDKAPAMIVEAVRAVARGEGRWFVSPPPPRDALDRLTDREEEVLRRMAEGASNDAIADDLHIAVNTVRNHVHNMYEKLEVHSSREAIAWAWRHGIINPPDTPP
jgi:DNA-binding NarL/FixJ family response regulator